MLFPLPAVPVPWELMGTIETRIAVTATAADVIGSAHAKDATVDTGLQKRKRPIQAFFDAHL
jgi:hypothetical protein